MFFEKKDTTAAAADGVAYGVLTGVLGNVNVPGLVKVTDHIFVGDTVDGGATPWLCDINADDGSSRPRLWRGRKEQSEELTPPYWPAVDSLPDAGVEIEADEIPIRCHCGGVDLVFRRPNTYFAAKERSELPWFIDPVTNKAWGGFDPCDTCRLSSGIDFFHWTFALLLHLAFPSTGREETQQLLLPSFPQSSFELQAAAAASSRDRDPCWGTLALYKSSPDVQRYFCSRCSACVLYASNERPDMVDVAVGLLDSPDGSRAEGLVSWGFGGKMTWRDDMIGGWRERFAESIETAADRWRIERGYPKNWRRIQKEEAAMRAQQ
jgi:hypothetical protein